MGAYRPGRSCLSDVVVELEEGRQRVLLPLISKRAAVCRSRAVASAAARSCGCWWLSWESAARLADRVELIRLLAPRGRPGNSERSAVALKPVRYPT